MATTPGAPTRTTDPVPLSWQRLAALAGVAFTVLFVITVALSSGTTPDIDEAASEWNAFAEDNEDKMRVAVIVMALTLYTFVLWLGYLRSVLADAERGLRGFVRMAAWPFAGGIIGIAGLALGVFMATASVAAEDAPGEVIRAVNLAAGSLFSLAEAGFATMLLAAWFNIRATRALPEWLGWVALVGGLAALLTFGTYLAEEYDNFFGIFYPLSWLFLLLFVLGTSVEFSRALGRGRAAESVASP